MNYSPPEFDISARQRASRVILQLADNENHPELQATSLKVLAAIRNSNNQRLQEILEEKPLFYELKESSPKAIHLEEDFSALKDTPEFQELAKAPTKFIEEQLPVINRGHHTHNDLPKGNSIKELLDQPYDISKIKVLTCGGKRFKIKRVDPKKNEHPLEEYETALKANANGIPTERPVGYIQDNGNTYLIFEYLENTISLNEFDVRLYKGEIDSPKDFDSPDAFSSNRWNTLYLFDKGPWSNEQEKLIQEISEKIIFEGFLIKINIDDVLKNPKAGLDRIIKHHSYSKIKETIKAYFLHYFGIDAPLSYKSIEDVQRIFSQLNEEKIAEIIKLIKQEVEEIREKFIELWKKYMPEIQKQKWGASFTLPYEEFKRSMEEKMKQAGVKHKDLARRNILVKFDDQGKLIPDEQGNAQFYIVDWEQR